MILFYSLYFSVYYKNDDTFVFLKQLIIELNDKFNKTAFKKKIIEKQSNKTSIKNEFDKTN